MQKRIFAVIALVAFVSALGLIHLPIAAQDKKPPKSLAMVLKDQKRRVAVVKKIIPTVVAVFARGGKGGGSGVLISKDGYALTNYHVAAPAGPVMKCGLADGHLYDAVRVGWDKVGDVALIKLLPKKKGEDFPFAPMGDSNKVHEGDWSLAAGNPFLLATDFTPTVTFGMISGVHRYQYPSGTFLEYTDCIQIDTSINPGNSGGPLYNMDGELIGINGRGSFDKRGRINSGVGYAISINQIKNFMGHLKAGMDCDHASLGAIVTTQTEDDRLGRMVVTDILEDSDVARRGLDFDDELLSFDGRLVTSVNEYLNIIGTYPRDWRVPMEYRRRAKTTETLVRLMGKQRRVLSDPNPKKPKGPRGRPGPPVKSAASKYYVAKADYANYYFNKLEKDRVLAAFKKHGDFTGLKNDWVLKGGIYLKKARNSSPTTIQIVDNKKRQTVEMDLDGFPYALDPLKGEKLPKEELRQPPHSGGFLAALYLYRQWLTAPGKIFSKTKHNGQYPVYMPPKRGEKLVSWQKQKKMANMIKTEAGPYLTNWYFDRDDNKLLAMEVRFFEENQDPCEVYFSDYRKVDGRLVPYRFQVKYANGHYGTIELESFDLGTKKKG